MATGTVKWFNNKKGYGFITPDEGGNDIFVHISAVQAAGMRTLNEGAKINYELALENDLYALQIYKNDASYLGQLIKVLARDFHQAVPVSYIGGVFQAGEYILKPLKETLQTTSCYLQSPLYPPEYGAYLLGCMYTQKILKK